MTSKIFDKPINIGLLIGGMGERQKRMVQNLIKEGVIDIIIGTHTLIQRNVEFKNLGFVVVDEQHRFGVLQRHALREKGRCPHVLVMSATPIPRSLALTIYGDLDLSIIDELPPGRKEVKTKWLPPSQRGNAYAFIKKKVLEGRQAFIICPLIEESEALQVKAAVEEYETLSREVFPDLRLGLLHGRMSTKEKEKVMRDFKEHKIDILVSTPVVEVGIDVPNATVMLIEGAERFGLSQLHQLRGRIRRSPYESYCLLLSDTPSKEAVERLALIEKVHDGFRLSEEDLRMRGPGEFFGTRQSGLPDLKMAKLGDIELLERARVQAQKILEEGLEKYKKLKEEMERIWKVEEIS